jgi:tetratricopeptide (TPR) repeat protein
MNEWIDDGDLIDRVQDMLEMSLYDEALKLLDNFGDHHTDKWDIHFLYSRIYSEQNNPKLALQHLKSCLKLDRNNLDSLLAIFYSYAQLTDMKRAKKYLFRAIKLDPEDEYVINGQLWYHAEIGDYPTVINIYEKYHGHLQYSPEALRNAGISYEHVGNFDKAILCFKTAMELAPEVEEIRDLLADHYLLRGNPEQSVEVYRHHLKNSPKNIRSMSRLVFCLSQVGNIQEAENGAKKIIEIYPNSPIGYVDYAYLFFNTGRVIEAVEMADKALDVAPLDAEAVRIKAIAASEDDNLDEADNLFDKAISLSSENPEIRRDYYNYLKLTGRYKEMEKEVLAVIKMDYPNCLEDYLFLAEFYREQNSRRKAFKYLLKAYRTMPGDKELIPPMVELLLELKHSSFTVPILKNYIEARGWDEMMNELSTHQKLKGKWSQEGMRFLQFYGQKNVDYRKFAFKIYVRKALFISLFIIFITFLILSGFYFGLNGMALFLISWAIVASLVSKISKRIKHRHQKKIKPTALENRQL